MMYAHNFPENTRVVHRVNGSTGSVVAHNEGGTKCKVEWTDGQLRGNTLWTSPLTLDRERTFKVDVGDKSRAEYAKQSWDTTPELSRHTEEEYKLKKVALAKDDAERQLVGPLDERLYTHLRRIYASATALLKRAGRVVFMKRPLAHASSVAPKRERVCETPDTIIRGGFHDQVAQGWHDPLKKEDYEAWLVKWR